MKKPYTKDQLVEALTTFANANKAMKDIISEGQWDLIRNYRKGQTSAESLYNELDVDALDGAVVRLRIELDAEDIGEIYGANDFHVEPTHESIKFLAGDVLLGVFKPDSEEQGNS